MEVDCLEPLVKLVTPDRCSDQIKNTSCKDEIDAALIQTAQRFGFEYLRCTRWVSGGKKRSTDSYSGHISNFPQGWTTYYDKAKSYEWDPVIRFYMDVESRLRLPYGTWEQARQAALTNPQGDTRKEIEDYVNDIDQLFAEANKHGLVSGVFMTTGDHFARIHISMGSSKPNEDIVEDLPPTFWGLFKTMQLLTKELFSYTQGCDQCVSDVCRPGIRVEHLTLSQRKILELFFDNRCATIKEISILYNSSVDNVNYHLKNIRTKFGYPGVSGHVLAQFAREHKLI
jgi:DNA-binding CsgD family transcriptional regulator